MKDLYELEVIPKGTKDWIPLVKFSKKDAAIRNAEYAVQFGPNWKSRIMFKGEFVKGFALLQVGDDLDPQGFTE